MAKLSHLDGSIDPARLAEAFATVVRASDALRSRVADVAGRPMLRIEDSPAVSQTVRLTRAEVLDWATERAAKPLDPSLRAYDSVIVSHEDGTLSWYLALHHLVTDATSSALVFGAVADTYYGRPAQIGSYLDWVATVETDDSSQACAARTAWSTRTPAPGLGSLYQPVRRRTTLAERKTVGDGSEWLGTVQAALEGQYRMITPELGWSALLLTVTAILMNKLTGASEFSIGLPVHNRSRHSADRVVGALVELFPVDVQIDPGDSFRSLHRRIGRSMMATLRAAVPGTSPGGDYEAVVNVVPQVALGDFGPVSATHRALYPEAVDSAHLIRLGVNAYGDDDVAVTLELNHSGADVDHRHRAAEHVRTIIDAMIGEPEGDLGCLELCTADELVHLSEWGTSDDFSDATPGLVQQLRSGLSGRPDIVIEDDLRRLSGHELWAEAVALACWLRQRGIGPGDRVGLQLPRSVDAVVAILGVLRSGASYVELDPAQPARRSEELASRAQCGLVLFELPDLVPDSAADQGWPDPQEHDEAYLLFTSGSTGEPKGVPISHVGLARHIRFAVEVYGRPAGPLVVAVYAALTFDLTVTSVFVPLVAGGRAVVVREAGVEALAVIASRGDVTWVEATPSHLEVLLRLLPDDHGLEHLVVGGEAFGSGLAQRFLERFRSLRIFNSYGPTEGAVACMIHEVDRRGVARMPEVPIGIPCSGVSLLILDSHGCRVPIGGQGELCISHVGLTVGYLGEQVPQTDHPFFVHNGVRYYRTGDLVRLVDLESLVYLGRLDDQIKVGGVRLEPTEVEEALEQHPEIVGVAARLWSGESTMSGSGLLTAWFVVESAHTSPSPSELRSFLAERLPVHAIPAAFVEVATIPTTRNGKLDLASLPGPAREHRPALVSNVEPTSGTEQHVVDTWQAVLGIDRVGADDDFFDLGGDSLSAMEMMDALSERWQITLREDLAFVHTTARELSAAIDSIVANEPSLLGPSASGERAGPPPAAVAERSILIDQDLRSDPARYNVGRLFRVQGVVDAERVIEALRTVAGMHVPLSWTHGSPRRQLGHDETVEAEIIETAVGSDEIEEALKPFHRKVIDPTNGPMIRCVIQPVDDGSSAILIAIHHVAIDAEASQLLWSQVDQVYSGRSLNPPAVDYPSFMEWQASCISDEDREHWIDAARMPVSRLTIDAPAENLPDGFVKRQASFLPRDLGAVRGATGFSAMLAGLGAALRSRADDDAIGLGVVASTRNHPSASDLVGYCLNTLPVIIECPGNATFEELCQRASATSRSALAHRVYPYSEIVRDRRESDLPAPSIDVMLAYDVVDELTFGGSVVHDEVLFNGSTVAGTATLFVEVRVDRVDLSLEYAGSAMSPSTAKALLDDVNAIVASGLTAPGTPVRSFDLPSARSSELIGPQLDIGRPLPFALRDNFEQLNADAVICGDQSMTWGELSARSADLAQALRDKGVGAGDRVIVCLPRSLDLVAAIVACHRIGACYVPIDNNYPDERIALICARSRARVAIAEDALPGLDQLDPASVRQSRSLHVDSDVDDDSEAYLIFTSGSTGQPRGVAVSHRHLSASTLAREEAYESAPERFLMLSSPAFDSSIVGLFWTLASGGCIVLPDEVQLRDPREMLSLIDEHRVSHALMVPTLYETLLAYGSQNDHWPEQVIVAGEPCSSGLVSRHFETCPSSKLTNEYGPTEATVWATVHHCSPGEVDVPIGRPIAGTWVAVVDSADRPVPEGVRGELIIGGSGIVDGYAGDESATARKFATGDRGRYFRTGDRAVVVDGTVRYRGRTDHQLNVGGVRIEPEEIERVILDDPAVSAAVVAAVDPRDLTALIAATEVGVLRETMALAARSADPATELETRLRSNSREVALVVHIEPVTGHVVDTGALRSRLRRLLPATHQPRKIALHSALPRSANGKVDRDASAALALAQDSWEPAKSGVVDDQVMNELVGLFREVLGVAAVGPEHSFFDLGGHSLMALRLIDRVEAMYDVRLSVAALYDAPTPADLRTVLADEMDGYQRLEFVVPIQPEGIRTPIFGVHILGVNASYYRPLSGRLGPDQPVFGLGLASSLENASAPTDVDRISVLYANEVDRVAPDGPVVLAAVSIGAAVMFELARCLRERGRDVALAVLFDAAGPDATSSRSRRQRLARHRKQFRRGPYAYVRARFTRLRVRSRRRLERLERRARLLTRVSMPDRLKIRGFVEANVEAAISYEVEPYGDPMLVFRAREDAFGLGRDDETMGWRSVAVGGLEVIDTAGGHTSMLAEPHVADLANSLTAAIDRLPRDALQPVPIDGDLVESQLRQAVEKGRFCAALADLGSSTRTLTDSGATVLDRADGIARALSALTRQRAREISEAIQTAGVDATVDPVPERLELARIGVSTIDDLEAVTAVSDLLGSMGYLPEFELSHGAKAMYWRGQTSQTLVRRDDASTRVRLKWRDRVDGQRTTTVFTPSAIDLSAVDLPHVGWPLYWVVRPLRLLNDRVRRRSGGGNLGPFLGTPFEMVEPLLELVELDSTDVLVDLGCGDGRVVVEAASRFGCAARGVEHELELVERARERVSTSGLSGSVEIVHSDARHAKIDDATVVFAFLPASVVAGMLQGILDRLAPGSRFICHEQDSVAWPIEPTSSTLILEGGVTIARMWLK